MIHVTTFTTGGNVIRTNLIQNGDFEASDLSGEAGNLLGWITYRLPDNRPTGQQPTGGSHGMWLPQVGSASPLSNQVVPTPHGLVQAVLWLAVISAGIAIYGLFLRLFGVTGWRDAVNAFRQTKVS